MSCKRSNSALHAVCAAATRVASSPLFRMTVNPRSRSSTAWRVMSEQGAASKGENAPIVNCEDKSNIRTGVNLFSLSRTIWSSHIVRSGVAEHEPKSSLKHTPGVVLSVGPILGPMEHRAWWAHASRDATTGQMPRKLNTTLLFYTQDLDGSCTLHTLHMTVTIRSQLLTPSFNKKYQDASNGCHPH